MPLKTLPRRIDRAFGRMGESSMALRDILMLHGDPSHPSWYDHFIGDSAGTWPASANWGYPATGGTGTEVIQLTAALGGVLTMTTGASANDSALQCVGLHWSGDTGFYYAARVKIDNIATSNMELGMSNAVTGDTGAVDTKATPTFTAANCALFARDTTDDTNITFVSNGGSVDGNADSAYAVASDTYFIVEIAGGGPTATTGDNVSGWINGVYVGGGNINGATLMTPHFFVETLAAETRTLSVDWGCCVGNLTY